MRLCPKCEVELEDTAFGKNKVRKDGLQVYCKPCMKAYRSERGYDAARWRDQREEEQARNRKFRHSEAGRAFSRKNKAEYRKTFPGVIRAKNAARKKHVARATPPWADKKEIAEIYDAAAMLRASVGYEIHVDHIYPLRGKTVCGLHVPENLQLLYWRDNLSKNNTVLH